MCHAMSFIALIVIGLVGTLIHVAGNESEEREPALPAELKVPAGHKLLFKVEAKGVQIYKSVAGKGGIPEWSFDAPLADLFDSEGKKVGCHYEGPSWESSDGSKVKKPDEKGAVKLKEAPNPKEDIPWLLIKVKAEEGQKGAFSKATYIQRIRTKGGKSPADIPVRIGTKVGVEYRAFYYFYGPAE